MNSYKLENLPEIIKEDKYVRLCTDIIKYQNFKTKAALSHFNNDFSTLSLKTYLRAGRHYIKLGEKTIKNKNFYKVLQQQLDRHVSPLTPCQNDKYTFPAKKYQSKEAKAPIIDTLKQIKTEDKKRKSYYGLNIKDKEELLLIETKDNMEFAKKILNFANVQYRMLIFKNEVEE
jgi:hypothetical protein